MYVNNVSKNKANCLYKVNIQNMEILSLMREVEHYQLDIDGHHPPCALQIVKKETENKGGIMTLIQSSVLRKYFFTLILAW